MGFTSNAVYITNGSSLTGTGFLDGTVAYQIGGNSTGAINFYYSVPLATGVIEPGEVSDVVIISTNAQSYSAGNASVQDGGSSGPLPAFQPASGASGFRNLYSFRLGTDGANPTAPLATGPGRVLYGATTDGGVSQSGVRNEGIVYSFTPPATAGGAWTEKVIYTFGGPDGANPSSGLIAGHGGVLFGVTSAGGAFGFGTVFSLTPPATAGGQWTEQVLYSFGNTRGREPYAITMGKNGILYGTTRYGGGVLGGSENYGTVWALVPPLTPGNSWRIDQLYAFQGAADGCHPVSGVTIGSDGTLYGVTPLCGASGSGTVYSLSPPATRGQPWSFSVLYGFQGTFDCSQPAQSPVLTDGGVLYGSASTGCGLGGGGVFSLTPPFLPGAAWNENVLHSFAAGESAGPILLGNSGFIYGTDIGLSTNGTVYVLEPPTTPGNPWQYGVLHAFTGVDGYHPAALSRIRGALFGTTEGGGTYNGGTIFEITF